MFMPFIAVMTIWGHGPWWMGNDIAAQAFQPAGSRKHGVPASWSLSSPAHYLSPGLAAVRRRNNRILGSPVSRVPSSRRQQRAASPRSCRHVTAAHRLRFVFRANSLDRRLKCARFRSVFSEPPPPVRHFAPSDSVFNPSRRRHVENEHLHVEQQQVSRNSNYVVVFAVVKTHTQILLYS